VHEARGLEAVTFPGRGDVGLANLDPTGEHEQAGTRPVLVVSDDVAAQAKLPAP